MVKLIIGCLALAAAGVIAFGKFDPGNVPIRKSARYTIASILCVISVALLAFALAHPVPAGNVGVVTVFGRPQDQVATEGLNFLPPWYNVVLMSKRTETLTGSTTAFTSDLQQATVTFAVMAHLPEDTAVDVFRHYGRGYIDSIIIPTFSDVLKNIVGGYTANTVVSDRAKLAMEVKEAFAARMLDYGIAVDDVAIPNIDFSDAFEASVEAANKARQDTIRVQEEAAQAKAKAEGEAAAKQAAADAEAYEKITVANAEADANRKLAESITPELTEYIKVTKWNGKLPTVTGTGGTIISMDTTTD